MSVLTPKADITVAVTHFRLYEALAVKVELFWVA